LNGLGLSKEWRGVRRRNRKEREKLKVLRFMLIFRNFMRKHDENIEFF
jgi:hypothetical protein